MSAVVSPNDEAAQVSHLIGDIYDAALDPERWDDVLNRACGFLDATAGMLASFDAAEHKLNMNKFWGYDPSYLQLYVDRYSKINPLGIASLRTSVGDVVATEDMMPLDEWRATAVYLEWAKPQGFVDAIQATLDKSATAMAVVGMVRHERVGMVDGAMRRRVQLLWPHFRRAVLIGKVIDLHKVEAASLADTLDGLSAAMFLVDAAGRIVHTNAAAHHMLNKAAVTYATGGKFAAVDPQANRALHDIFMNAENGDAAVGAKGIAIPLSARDGERYVAHVLPLTSGARRKTGVTYSAVAAVFVRKATLDLPHPLDKIASTFKLTPAEMRILMMFVELSGVHEVALVLGISEATVKTHLQRIFSKTETRRQADLVRLVAGYMSPLG
jgi:DNA-binding CsgD family transcriptional regulator/PAS domain-containing protein